MRGILNLNHSMNKAGRNERFCHVGSKTVIESQLNVNKFGRGVPMFFNGEQVDSKVALLEAINEDSKGKVYKVQWNINKYTDYECAVSVMSFPSEAAFKRSDFCSPMAEEHPRLTPIKVD
ncbi:hypothetical protein [Vibrio phage RYC]|nr:hypothetical protein [Vibrio phage RYC]